MNTIIIFIRIVIVLFVVLCIWQEQQTLPNLAWISLVPATSLTPRRHDTGIDNQKIWYGKAWYGIVPYDIVPYLDITGITLHHEWCSIWKLHVYLRVSRGIDFFQNWYLNSN